MKATRRLDEYQKRHRWLGFPIAVLYKFIDDQGSYLAALITYYGFLSVFPLLLLLSSVLGFVLQGDPELQARILNSALSQFPVIGEQLGGPHGLRGSGEAIVFGVLGSIYGSLGVAQAAQNAMNVMWAVPRNRRPNPFLARARSLGLLLTVGIAVLGVTVVSGIVSDAGSLHGGVGTGLVILGLALSIVLNAAVFLLGFQLSTARRLSLRVSAPGALAAGVLWQVLQWVGAVYVTRVIRDASALNGVFAIVLGLIAWIYLGAASVLLCVEVNVVRANRLYPRTLLTPFTDNVVLTTADETAYAAAAKAQRAKGFERIDVKFDRRRHANGFTDAKEAVRTYVEDREAP